MKQATLKNRLILCLVIIAILLAFYIVKAFTEGLMSNYFTIALLSIGAAIIIAYLKSGTDKYRKLKELLYRDCSPEVFVKEARTMLREESEKKRPKNMFMLNLYIAEGLYAAGKFQESSDTLVASVPSMQKACAKMEAVRWNHLFFLNCMELGKPDTARKALFGMKQALGELKPGKAAVLYERVYNEDARALAISEGDYEGAEQAFREMHLNALSNYEMVYAAFMRAKIYKHLGKDKQAEEFFGYVVQNGNTLYIADKAAEYLGMKD